MLTSEDDQALEEYARNSQQRLFDVLSEMEQTNVDLAAQIAALTTRVEDLELKP